MYVPLQIISAYSLLKSTISLHKLVKRAHQLGYRSLALTDLNVMYGSVEFYNLCQSYHIHPIIGLTLSISGNDQIILLAKNQAGYQNLMKLSTLVMTRPSRTVQLSQIRNHSTGLYVITTLGHVFSNLIESGRFSSADHYLNQLKKITNPELIRAGIGLNNPSYIRSFKKICRSNHVQAVALAPVKYLQSDDHFALRVLNSIHQDRPIPSPVKVYQNDLGRDWLKSERNMVNAFQEIGLTGACQATGNLAQSCQVQIKKRQARLPHFSDQNEHQSGYKSSAKYLLHLSQRGLVKRLNVKNYRDVPDPYQHRLWRELKVIHDMGFDDYFLIVWDIVRFIRKSHITTGDGRGSAAGSLVAYVLFITDVDPLKYHLLFERFLNRERAQMPDIDLDIPDDRRDEVLRYVHDKYSPGQVNPLTERVSQIITFDTMAAKQSLRDVGRSFGLKARQLNQWSQAVPRIPKVKLNQITNSEAIQTLCQAGTDENPNVRLNQLLFKTAQRIEGLPRHDSIHAAGLILCDQPLVKLSPLQTGSEQLLVTQYSKNYAEGVGLLKIDFLGLRNLTLLGNVLKLVHQYFDPHFNLRKINLEDPETLKLFQAGDTDGVFQFESSGIQQVLRKIKPDSFGIVAIVDALYRPGPIKNIDLFIKRRKQHQSVKYPSQSLKKVLAPTYGIIIYQEQVMLVAQIMGGFTLGEADILRRAMSKKNHSIMAKMQDKFLTGAKQKGFSASIAKRTFDYMNRFASYGFNKSHAVAYSKLAFQLAYLKVHYSPAFFAALLNSVAGNRQKIRRYLAGARRLGVRILPPDINLSSGDCTIWRGQLRLGLNFLRGISTELVRTIIENRQRDFVSLNQFIFRIYPYLLLTLKSSSLDFGQKNDNPIRILFPLIYSGALDSISKIKPTDQTFLPRSQLRSACYRVFHCIDVYYHRISKRHQSKATTQEQIYREIVINQREIQSGVNDFEALGLKISADPDRSGFDLQRKEYYYLNFNEIELFDPLIKPLRIISLGDLKHARGEVMIMVKINNVHSIHTKRGELMAFANGSDSFNQISLVFFPTAYRQFRQLLNQRLVLVIRGKVELRHGLQVIADQVWPAANLLSELNHRTYDWRKHCCFLRIKSPKDSTMNHLYQVITNSPGRYPIFIDQVWAHRKYLLNSKYSVNDHHTTQSKLIKLLGKRNVVFK